MRRRNVIHQYHHLSFCFVFSCYWFL